MNNTALRAGAQSANNTHMVLQTRNMRDSIMKNWNRRGIRTAITRL